MNNSYDYIKGIEEKQFVKTVIDYTKRADQQYRPFFTDFYNKDWMQSLIDQYAGKSGYVNYMFFGGYEGAERQVLGIAPYEITEEDFEIGAIWIDVKTGIGKALTHRDYLGAILGLGIERCMIGDIIPSLNGAYVILSVNMIPYIRSQLTSIGRYQKIEITEVEMSSLQACKPKIKEINTTVSALRMDTVIAATFGLSRTECAKLIQGDKARCNGMAVTPSDMLKEGDAITLRGYGKAKLKSVNGHTKKERLHITIEKYI